MKKSYMALAAAIAAGLSAAAPPVTVDPNHAAAFHRPRYVRSSEQRRHLTKGGPGRAGHKGRSKARVDRKYAWIYSGIGRGRFGAGYDGHTEQRRNLRKLLGTRG